MSKTIFRVAKNADNPFVMIDRRVIENPKLSWKAKGLLAYLLSRPDNWVVRFRDLVNRAPDGAHTVRVAMKELKAAGHVKITTEREEGRVTRWVYTVYESPDVDFQQVVIQQVENRTLNNKDINETKNHEDEGKSPKSLFSIYENEIGLLTPFIADAIEGWLKDGLPEKWIADGIHEAAAQNKRSWKYVEAILKRWDAQGNQNPVEKPVKHNGRAPAATRQDQNQATIQSWLAKKQAANNG
jgi:DnaD/phage-associated family protein